MILDKELEIVSGTAIDLGPKKPGPGKPIKCIARKVSANVTITTGADNLTLKGVLTVTCGGAELVEFELPSNIEQFVNFTFADGNVEIVLAGNQTNT